jgi:hypothetical protein
MKKNMAVIACLENLDDSVQEKISIRNYFLLLLELARLGLTTIGLGQTKFDPFWEEGLLGGMVSVQNSH